MSKRICLSAVITLHDEGLIAHKTMRSVFEALAKVKEAGHNYEIIVHIDNGNEATFKYFERYEKDKNIRVFKNKFGDLGLSRNFAVSVANGKYVTFLDGDDLISDNWYINAIETLEKANEEIVVHPEAILTFGVGQPVLTLQGDSLGVEKDTLILLGENRWCSVAMATKETFIKYPYVKMGNGYSFEDYLFNADTIAGGVEHRVAKNTVLFYRKSGKSMLDKANGDNAVLPYSKLFDFEKVKELDDTVKVSNKRISLKKCGYKIYRKVRDNDVLNFFITPVAKMTLKIIDRGNKGDIVPEWVVDEWKKINHIDTQLYPLRCTVSKVKKYSAEEYIEVGKAYVKIAKGIVGKSDYIFIVPWLIRGGAERALLNYIDALRAIHPDWHLTIVATLPAKHVWVKNLPENVDFIDFGNICFGLNPVEQDKVMSKLIVQLKCPNLHIVNSEYGYGWVKTHKSLVKNNYNLNVSLFAYEYIDGSHMKAVFSYDNPYLFEIFDVVKNVFTDNKAVIKYVMEQNGFDDKKFKVHYQPVKDLSLKSIRKRFCEDGVLHLLWAGRVVPIKLPELVVKIGKHLDAKKIRIDIYGELSPEVEKNIFNNTPAIKYCGPYDGFNSLPVEKYDALLYTSLTDGMPNVILEATAAGLPVIASNDGGVGEFIEDGKTGVLIEDYLDYASYIEAFDNVMKKPDVLLSYVKNAQKRLAERHSFTNFVQTVKKDLD